MIDKFSGLSSWYEVDGKVYDTKLSALLACADGQYPQWKFFAGVNDFDWRVEPPGTLREWYCRRAWQLREKYDNIIIMFSGGIDSTAMLRTFVDNGIPFEGVASYGSFGMNRAEQYLRNQEIFKVAIPFIRDLQQRYRLHINYHLIDDVGLYKVYDDADWFQSAHNGLFSPEVAFYRHFGSDPWILDHCQRGRTVLLRGVDKPRIIFEDNTWKVIFLDIGSQTLADHWQRDHDNLYYDFFYWSPDMPEVVSKQAHAVRNFFQGWDPNSLAFRQLFSRQHQVYKRSQYVSYIDPIIYEDYVAERPGEPRKYFSLGKSQHQNYWQKDDAFFAGASELQLAHWKQGVDYLSQAVPAFFYNAPDKNLQQFLSSGLVGIWSQEFIIGDQDVQSVS
jgi:hypothetical protein